MPDHYFSETPNSAHRPRTFVDSILGQTLTFHTDAGVFSRDGIDTGSRILMEASAPFSGRVLDMGAGWGAVGVSVAKAFPETHVVMAEINSRAIELIHANLRENGVANAETVSTDGYANVAGQYDVILTNPPIRAGKAVIYRMFADARGHLAPGGRMDIVIRKQQGAPSAVKYLKTLYAGVDVIEKQAGFWIIRCGEPLASDCPPAETARR
ncbi:MAG: methyltransferase [Clostridia bacterium]|nr:methyltransferase [Clostridia bacterium]